MQFPYLVQAQYEHRTAAYTIYNTTVLCIKRVMLHLMWLNCLCHKLKTPTGHKGRLVKFNSMAPQNSMSFFLYQGCIQTDVLPGIKRLNLLLSLDCYKKKKQKRTIVKQIKLQFYVVLAPYEHRTEAYVHLQNYCA